MPALLGIATLAIGEGGCDFLYLTHRAAFDIWQRGAAPETAQAEPTASVQPQPAAERPASQPTVYRDQLTLFD